MYGVLRASRGLGPERPRHRTDSANPPGVPGPGFGEATAMTSTTIGLAVTRQDTSGKNALIEFWVYVRL